MEVEEATERGMENPMEKTMGRDSTPHLLEAHQRRGASPAETGPRKGIKVRDQLRFVLEGKESLRLTLMDINC